MTVRMVSRIESGWRITFVVKSKTSGRVFRHLGTTYEAKTKKDCLERFAKWRAKKEAGGCVFEDVSEPKRYKEKREYLCF